MMSRKTIIAFVLLLVVAMSACTRNEIYSNFVSLETPYWHADSTMSFEFNVEDVDTEYELTVNMRHRANYPYQNMWLFIQQISPDSSIVSDTIEFYLANDRGKWLGKGIGAVYTMPVLIKNNYSFEKPGLYKIELQHGMRDVELYGVNDMGLVIEKSNK